MNYTQPSRAGTVAALLPFIHTRRSGHSEADIDYVELARKAWPYLVQVARKELSSEFWGEGKITYGELCEKIGLSREYGPLIHSSSFLGIIEEYCRRQEIPPLQAVAVNRRTGVPGRGYQATARRGKEYQQALKDVYDYQWLGKPPLLISEGKSRQRRIAIRILVRRFYYLYLLTFALLLVILVWRLFAP